jgi:hypothetical protein
LLESPWGLKNLTTIGTELTAILGKAVGISVGRRVGYVVGLVELGNSEPRMVGTELVAILGRAVGSCVGGVVGLAELG